MGFFKSKEDKEKEYGERLENARMVNDALKQYPRTDKEEIERLIAQSDSSKYFLVIKGHRLSANDLEILNEKGWELVTSHDVTIGLHYYFQRQTITETK